MNREMRNIGEYGERLVASWLETKSYQILHRSWSCRWGEIDLIALDRRSTNLIFVEVKTRSDRNWDNDGLLAIDERKQEKICQTATLFLAKNPELSELPCRFDVALVLYKKDANLNFRKDYLTFERFLLDGDRYKFILQTYLQAAFEVF